MLGLNQVLEQKTLQENLHERERLERGSVPLPHGVVVAEGAGSLVESETFS